MTKEETKTAEVAKPATPAAAEKKTRRVRKPGVFHLIDWILILVMVVALGYVAYTTHTIFADATPSTTTSVAAQPSVAPVPVLKLNESRQRQGPEVQGEQGVTGRDNPFVKP